MLETLARYLVSDAAYGYRPACPHGWMSLSKWINALNTIKRILEVWIHMVCRFAWGVILGICALTYVLFIYAADNLTINTNTTDMLSEELPFRQHYTAYKEAFPQDSDLITIVVEAVTPDRADVAALALAAR
jgi:uncharacterized membrane protein YdfJ with MMPL/SSD domain